MLNQTLTLPTGIDQVVSQGLDFLYSDRMARIYIAFCGMHGAVSIVTGVVEIPLRPGCESGSTERKY